jgi:hypothetical protein
MWLNSTLGAHSVITYNTPGAHSVITYSTPGSHGVIIYSRGLQPFRECGPH